MGRPLRFDPTGGWHHVMNRGVARQTIFFGDADRVEFGRLLGVIHRDHSVRVHAYCLMDNHYHLLLHCPEGGLSSAMHQFASAYVRHANNRIGRDGPLFRGRFHSRPILSNEYLVSVVRYIHRNPLVRTDVDRAERFRWSSHRTYLGLRRRPDWLDTSTVLEWFAHDRRAFARFVDDECDIGRPLESSVDVHDLLGTIEFVLAEMSTSAASSRRAELRCVALVTGELLPHMRAAIDEALKIETRSGRTKAVGRAKSLLARTPQLHDVVRTVIQLITTPTRRAA